MNGSGLLDLERELRRRRREQARRGRRTRRRAIRVAAAALAIVVLAAFAVARGGLPALHAGSGSPAATAHATGGGRAQLAPSQSAGPPPSRTGPTRSPTGSTGSPTRSPTDPTGSPTDPTGSPGPSPDRSPAGLPLGRPPLTLTPGPASQQVDAPFHHPPLAGLLFDIGSGHVLWQLNPLVRLHIASLTKMMTALLVARTSQPDEGVPVTPQAVAAAGSKVGVLPAGRRVLLRTLLYGLMLPSGNDAAVALAQHVSGTIGAFVDAMNAEAARLGLGCTRFSSPSGYVNARNYSCAADLAVLAHVDLEQPLLARVVRAARAVEPLPIKGGRVWLYNNNPLLVYGYPGATGLKTGYTELAGDCLVGTAERGGVRLGVVLLHSPELGHQAEFLLDRGFAAYGQRPVPAPPVPRGR
jgi:serine-type D-Ala-D-Ala carboxypeptidase (penicillin-binding protein 5/6)